MLKRISYPLSPQSPLYLGTPEISRSEGKSIAKGESANTTLLIISTHAGTHIDVPRHFCPEGKTTRDMLRDRFALSPVYCIDLPAKPSTAIRIADIGSLLQQFSDAKGIFLRTGMYRLRASDPDRYCTNHPWIHPELPSFLRAACPMLALFGTDTISITNPQFRNDGRECHRAFLCDKNPIMLAEDLDLSDSGLVTGPLSVSFYPWIVDDLDGVPVHAFAEIT
jgi:kynurenine formamidase